MYSNRCMYTSLYVRLYFDHEHEIFAIRVECGDRDRDRETDGEKELEKEIQAKIIQIDSQTAVGCLLATNEGYVETEIGMEIATDVLGWLPAYYCRVSLCRRVTAATVTATATVVTCFAASNLIK